MSMCGCLRSAGRTVGLKDLKFGTHIKDHHISEKIKVTKVKMSFLFSIKVKTCRFNIQLNGYEPPLFFL